MRASAGLGAGVATTVTSANCHRQEALSGTADRGLERTGVSVPDLKSMPSMVQGPRLILDIRTWEELGGERFWLSGAS